MKTAIGKMRHFIEVQTKQYAPDGGGGESVTWVKSFDIWGYIRPVSGAQRMESLRRNSSISHEIMTKWHDEITSQQRLVWEGKIFNIDATFSPDEKREYLRIIASEGVAT